jgi:hypothetical protein
MASSSSKDVFLLALDIGSGACKGALFVLGQEGAVTEAAAAGIVVDDRQRDARRCVAAPPCPLRVVKQLYGREVTSLLGHDVAAQPVPPPGQQRIIPVEALKKLSKALEVIMTESEAAFHRYVACRACCSGRRGRRGRRGRSTTSSIARHEGADASCGGMRFVGLGLPQPCFEKRATAPRPSRRCRRDSTADSRWLPNKWREHSGTAPATQPCTRTCCPLGRAERDDNNSGRIYKMV